MSFTRLADGDVLGVYRDITKQRRAERALKRRNRDMQALLDALPDSVFRLDSEGICLEHKASGHFPTYPPAAHNPATHNPATHNPATYNNEIAGVAITDIAPPEIVPLLHQHMDALRTTGALQVFHYTLHRDGQVHYYEARLAPISGGDMLLLTRDISPLRRTELALLQRERDSRNLLEAFPDAIVRFNHEGVYLDVKLPHYPNANPNLPASAMIGKLLEEVAPADAVPVLREALTETLTTRSPQRREYTMQWQGQTLYREARFVPLDKSDLDNAISLNKSAPDKSALDNSDNAEVLAIIRDISSERRAQRQLERREKQLQAIFDTLPYGISRYSRSGICLERKRPSHFTTYSAIADDDTIGKTIEEIAPADIRDNVVAHFHALLATNQVQVFDYQHERDGRTFYREATLLPLGDDEILSVIRDISEQRRIEQRLIEREQQMKAIFSALPDVIAQFNRAGVYLSDIHGGQMDNLVPLEQAQGKTFFEMNTLAADDAKALHAALEETFATQQEHSHEYGLEIDGKTYYRELRFVYLREDTCLGILRDITPWREMDMALQRALEHSTVLLKEVHHRVRNNLQVLSSVLHLHAASIDDELAKRVLLENRRRIQTLALVHRVLYDNESYANIALDQYLASGTGLFAADMRRMKVALELDTDSVAVDLDQAIPFGLIVNELITNTLRHAFTSDDYKDGIITAQLQVTLRQQDNHVTLQVIDNGVGLPADFADKQQRTLGMAVISSLSEQLAGTFSISNRKDALGTEATLTFTC